MLQVVQALVLYFKLQWVLEVGWVVQDVHGCMWRARAQ